MRSPTDVPPRPRRLGRLSRRFWFGLIFVVILVGFLSLRNLAVLWTDEMWFSSVRLSSVFSTLFFIKVGLGLTFGAIFFFIMWGNLLLTDRFGARDLSFDPEDEVVRRFQNVVRPYAKRIYAAIALVMGAHRRPQRHRASGTTTSSLPTPSRSTRPTRSSTRISGSTSSRCPSCTTSITWFLVVPDHRHSS